MLMLDYWCDVPADTKFIYQVISKTNQHHSPVCQSALDKLQDTTGHVDVVPQFSHWETFPADGHPPFMSDIIIYLAFTAITN